MRALGAGVPDLLGAAHGVVDAVGGDVWLGGCFEGVKLSFGGGISLLEKYEDFAYIDICRSGCLWQL